ncbi:MAG TPA: type II toxin-antitoxin system death-on-curing family toxin [Thermoanaerobaculia bacterium]|nr:type II toxin-antitoxin system death-on-curing family toxin [Thermoanaerobaculia bacterium]
MKCSASTRSKSVFSADPPGSATGAAAVSDGKRRSNLRRCISARVDLRDGCGVSLWDLPNHPFIDGNKRTAAGAALTFLEMNDVEVDAYEDAFYDLVIGVAEGRVSKAAVTVFLEKHAG